MPTPKESVSATDACRIARCTVTLYRVVPIRGVNTALTVFFFFLFFSLSLLPHQPTVHVFDFDYDAVVANQVKLAQNFSMCCPCTLPCWFGCFKQNLIDSINARHIAITRDGIRFVHDQRRQGCRLDCQTAGKTTKTIPFDKLTDCDIEEPAGASGPVCCMVNNVLTKVNIDTASSGMRVGENGQRMNLHELTLQGLVDPHGFKSMVWRMKRSGSGGGGSSSAPQAMNMSRDTKEIVAALNGQNALLKEQNSLLLKIVANTSK